MSDTRADDMDLPPDVQVLLGHQNARAATNDFTEPYQPSHPVKPSPIHSGGWSGRNGTRSIVPHKSFDAKTIKEAIAILQGTSAYYRFEPSGKAGVHALKRIDADPDKNISQADIEVLRATVAILANCALRSNPANPRDVLNQYIQLTAVSRDLGELGVAIQQFATMKDDPAKRPAWIDEPQEKTEMDLIYEQIERDYPSPEPDYGPSNSDNLAAMMMDDIEKSIDKMRTLGKDLSSPDAAALMREALHAAEIIRTDFPEVDLMRFHNSRPEAFNFMAMAHHIADLVRSDGAKKPILDIQHFVNSYFMNVLGNVELSVSSSLIEEAKTLLKHDRAPAPEATARAGA